MWEEGKAGATKATATNPYPDIGPIFKDSHPMFSNQKKNSNCTTHAFSKVAHRIIKQNTNIVTLTRDLVGFFSGLVRNPEQSTNPMSFDGKEGRFFNSVDG